MHLKSFLMFRWCNNYYYYPYYYYYYYYYCYYYFAVFLLGSPTQIYKFLAPSESAKNTWVKKLKMHIDKEKEAFVKVNNSYYQNFFFLAKF